MINLYVYIFTISLIVYKSLIFNKCFESTSIELLKIRCGNQHERVENVAKFASELCADIRKNANRI